MDSDIRKAAENICDFTSVKQASDALDAIESDSEMFLSALVHRLSRLENNSPRGINRLKWNENVHLS